MSGHEYDAFISYGHGEPDKTWVRRVLVPGLTQLGLAICIDHRCFRLGAPVLLEMERAIIESAYTIAIMTPRYLRSRFAELENVLAETLGLERGQRRLLAVLREPCTPPLRMRARLYLDMTDDGEVAEGLSKLADALRTSPDG